MSDGSSATTATSPPRPVSPLRIVSRWRTSRAMGIHVYHARMSVPVLNRTPNTRRKRLQTSSSSLAPSDSRRRLARAARPRQRSPPAQRLRTRRRRNGAPARRNRGIRTQRCSRDRIARWPASPSTWSEIPAQCSHTSTSNRRQRRQGRRRRVRHAVRGQSMRLSASRPAPVVAA